MKNKLKDILATSLLGFLSIPLYAHGGGTENLVLSQNYERQQLEGWGVSLCWWANMCGKWGNELADQITDWLVGEDGLGYNIFRFNIPGGDDPANRNCKIHHMAYGKGLRAEMQGYKSSPTASYNWGADAGQRNILLKIKERNPDAVFEAFCNTPPYFMTYSGCASGAKRAVDDNLRTSCYVDYARYLIDVCQHYRSSFGIEFKTLEPFNEPETDYWRAGGGQEGCHFELSTMINFTKVIAPMLRKSGLKTVLAMTDETSVEQSVRDYEAFRLDTAAFNAIGQWNVHTYEVDETSRMSLQNMAKADKMPLWVSETGLSGDGLKGNLQLTQRLFDDMRLLQPQAWCDWQAVEEDNDQWCTVTANFQTGEAVRNKNYYVRQQVTHFIRPGYRFIYTPSAQTLAAVSPTRSQLVVVNINLGEDTQRFSLDFSEYAHIKGNVKAFITDENRNCAATKCPVPKRKTIEYSLPPCSIQTLVIQ